MTKEKINEYTLKITQSSKTQLIVVLYELAQEYICEAKKAHANNNHDNYRTECTNAVRVIQDLIDSLDFSYEISMPLYRIYEYMTREISMAVIRNKTEGLDAVDRYLNSLKSSFETVAKQDTGGPLMGNTQSVYAGLTYGRGVLNENISGDGNRGYKV